MLEENIPKGVKTSRMVEYESYGYIYIVILDRGEKMG
jgi:hypothetical protein